VYSNVRYTLDQGPPLQPPCRRNALDSVHLHYEQCQQSRPWECGNPEGISKECGKGGKPASWLSMLSILCHFHGLLWKRVSQNCKHRKGPFWERKPLSELPTIRQALCVPCSMIALVFITDATGHCVAAHDVCRPKQPKIRSGQVSTGVHTVGQPIKNCLETALELSRQGCCHWLARFSLEAGEGLPSLVSRAL
jgi:hypothetical protein